MDSILNVTKCEGGKRRESWPGMPHVTPEKYHCGQDGAGKWAPVVVQRIPTQSCLVCVNVFTCLSGESWQCTHSDCGRGSAEGHTAARLVHMPHCSDTGSVPVCAMPFLCFPALGARGVLRWWVHRTEPQPSSEGSAIAVRRTGMFCRGDIQDGTVTIRPLRSIVLPCFQGFGTRRAG